MKTFALLSSLAMTTPLGAQPVPEACKDDQCIQVGSYNIEHLGSKNDEGTPRKPRRKDDIAKLALRVAVDLDLEVVVFQEIDTGSGDWQELKKALQEHGYSVYEGKSSGRQQFVVLAWDADEVELLDNSAHEVDVRNEFAFGECAVGGLRKPVAARFKAGAFDFWVVGVHLKSRSVPEKCTSKKTSELRMEQCHDLVRAVDKLAQDSGEQDLLIVGDFNELMDDKSLKPLVSAGFISQMAYLMPSSALGSFINTSEINDLIDQVMLRYSNTKEVVKNSAFVLRIPSEEVDEYLRTQSDHVPVCVSFRIDQDLDGPD